MAINIPARAHGPAIDPSAPRIVFRAALGINGHHDALGAVFGGCSADHIGVGNGGRVEAGLVGPRIEQAAHVFHGAHTATHGERNEHLAGHGLDDVQDQVAPVTGGSDVQKRELVGALGVVARGNFDRVACIAQFDKIDAFDDPATGDVKAGDDAFGKHAQGVWLLRTRPARYHAGTPLAGEHSLLLCKYELIALTIKGFQQYLQLKTILHKRNKLSIK